MKRVYLATRAERAWHWVNAVGFVLLVLSGLNIHFAREFNVFGTFAAAIAVHNLTGIVVSVDYMLWAFYMVQSGRLRFYVPEEEDLPAGVLRQARYYLLGIFRGAAHPFEEGESRKFNPLQKWTYIGVMAVLMPIQLSTGVWLLNLILAWQYADPGILRILGVTHTVVGIFLTAFLFGHIYLATTGDTPWAHFKMMFTGWAEPHGTSAAKDQGILP